MSEELQIQQLFEQRLLTWADNEGLSVALPNVGFTPPATGAYLRAYLLPALPSGEFLDGKHTAFAGIFQVSICAPLNEGAGPTGLLAAQLRALFPNQLELTATAGFKVKVMSPLSVPEGFNDGKCWLTPTSFEYRADTTS